MMASPTFRRLDALTTAHRPFHLVDNSADGVESAEYRHEDHEILAPAAEQDSRLRGLMLFEMHNASRRGSARRIENLRRGGHNEDGTLRADESEHVALFRQAAHALAREWHEWILTPEHAVESRRIDDDLGGGGGHVENLFGTRFQHPDGGWFHFVNYMNEQMQRGHTQRYDPNVGHPQWPGLDIYQLVLATSPASLRITKREFDGFRSGARRRVKNDAHNPFRINANWRRAAEIAGRRVALSTGSGTDA